MIGQLLTASLLDYTAIERNNRKTLDQIYTFNQSEHYQEKVTLTPNYLSDLSGAYNVYEKLSSLLKREYELGNINSNVYKTSFDVVNKLPESTLMKLNINDNVYTTNYGSLVLDWEDNSSTDEFSLEIGDNCFGYFSEYEGENVDLIEEVKCSLKEINALDNKIEGFYNRRLSS